jgi:hypothetical protein
VSLEVHQTLDRARVQLLPGGEVIPLPGSRHRSPSPPGRRSSSSMLGCGRSPPRSPRALERFHASGTFLQRSSPCLPAWLTPTCFRAQVSPAGMPEELPPPPPLLTTGPHPQRLFWPSILQRAPTPTPPTVSPGAMRSQMDSTPLRPFQLALDREASNSHAPSPMVQEVQPLRLSEELATPVYVPATPTTLLFVPVQAPLLQAPSSTPPRKPTNRRKTLAGVTGFAGIPVQRSSPWLRAKKRSMPIA